MFKPQLNENSTGSEVTLITTNNNDLILIKHKNIYIANYHQHNRTAYGLL